MAFAAYLPYTELNIADGTRFPSATYNFNNRTYAFWERALFQRALSTLDIEVPEKWEGETRDFLLYCLFAYGFIAIFNREGTGTSFQPGTLSGFDFYYQPTRFIFNNPQLKANEKNELRIHEDCALLKLTPDYRGACDVISYYAEKLALLDNAINMSLINNKFAFILGAKNKSAAAALKKVLDLVNRGEPAVVYDRRIVDDINAKTGEPFQTWNRDNLKQSYLTTEQLQDFQTLLNNFDTEIGIPNLPYQKKERLVTAEAESKNIDSVSRSIVWFETLQSSLIECRKMFPEMEDFKVSLRWRDQMQAGGLDDDSEGGEEDVTR